MTTSQTILAGRYRLHKILGQGGMGRVWLATDELLDRQVAVKEVMLPDGLTADEVREIGARASREARAAARLSHPNVIIVYDIVVTDTVPWIVMEYLPSSSLHQKVVRDGPLSPFDAARVGLHVLAAVRAAHEVGVVHRDIKPSNVLLTDSGRVVLTDFGLATVVGDPTLTRTGRIFGSPAYMAPERARDSEVNVASDLWSLGATLYFAVEGRSPYQRDSALATLAALASEEPDPTARAGVLRPVLDGLLRRDPGSRLPADRLDRMLRGIASGAAAGKPANEEPRQHGATPTEAMPAAGRARDQAAIPRTAVLPAVGRAAIQQPLLVAADPAGDSGERRIVSPGNRRQAAIAAMVSLVAAAAVSGWALTRSDDPADNPGAPVQVAPSDQAPSDQAPSDQAPSDQAPSDQAPSIAASTPPPSLSPSVAADALPTGWHVYTDRTGFSLAVPQNWRVTREGSMVYFREPGGPRVLGIDQTDQPKPDPVADWQGKERARVAAGDFPSYQRVRLERVDYFLKAADWEFTHDGNAGRLHVYNRGFVTSSTKAYGMWWSTLDTRWDEDLSDLQLIQGTFTPAG